MSDAGVQVVGPDGTLDERLDALRAQGAAQTEPVRLHLLEALARRAARHDGAARQRLDARLAELATGLQARLASPAPAAPARPARTSGPLAALAASAGQRLRAGAPTGQAGRPAPFAVPGAPADEHPALRPLRATWARLSAERRLAQSRAQLPGNAGPLNSQHLVHRSLALMHELSPTCLQHFFAHMDGLMWLQQVNEGVASQAERKGNAG